MARISGSRAFFIRRVIFFVGVYHGPFVFFRADAGRTAGWLGRNGFGSTGVFLLLLLLWSEEWVIGRNSSLAGW